MDAIVPPADDTPAPLLDRHNTRFDLRIRGSITSAKSHGKKVQFMQQRRSHQEDEQAQHLSPNPPKPTLKAFGNHTPAITINSGMIQIGSSFPDFPSPGNQKEKQFLTPRRATKEAPDIDEINEVESLEGYGTLPPDTIVFRADGCPEIKSPTSKTKDYITDFSLKHTPKKQSEIINRTQEITPIKRRTKILSE